MNQEDIKNLIAKYNNAENEILEFKERKNNIPLKIWNGFLLNIKK